MPQIELEQARFFRRKSVSPTTNRLQVKLSGRVVPGPRRRAPSVLQRVHVVITTGQHYHCEDSGDGESGAVRALISACGARGA